MSDYQQQQQPSGDSYGTDQAGYGGDQQDLSGAGGAAGDQGGFAQSDPSNLAQGQGQGQEKKDRRREHEAGVGGVAAGGFAAHERHKAEKDPEHPRRHKAEEGIAGVGAVGAEGEALHKRHEKKRDEQTGADQGGEKKEGLF